MVVSSIVRKHSVKISGHATSVSIETEFWEAFKNIASKKKLSINDLLSEIDKKRTSNLSSAIRIFILNELIATTGYF
jgi:predicted DNA-binding ribbon-helix-helix protein